MAHSYDLVIRRGTVVDGTGAPPYEADVAIAGSRIVAVGDVPERGAEEIEARDRLVTPGFVDIHTHYDGQITWDRRLAPSSLHGATTVLMGNCGVGFAPCTPEHRETLIRLMEGVEDIPGIVMADGIPWEWESFPEYLDFLDRRRSDVDFATQVPHCPVRVHAMGQRGADREPATAADMAAMTAIVEQAIAAGALGFSTTRIMIHRRKDGVLAPSVTAGEEELLAISAGLKTLGKGVLQMVGEFGDTTAGHSTEFAMWKRIVAECGRPLSFNLVQSPFIRHVGSTCWISCATRTPKVCPSRRKSRAGRSARFSGWT
jgi:N-acyl-D-aspartate/D-glutamate deacylase